MNVRKDGARKSEDSDYVKVETKLSRARNGAARAKQDVRRGRLEPSASVYLRLGRRALSFFPSTENHLTLL